jgi:hypothetical protein
MLDWQDKLVDILNDYVRDAYLGMIPLIGKSTLIIITLNAYLGITPLIGKSTLTMITLDDHKIQSLLREFPDQSKASIAFVVPISQAERKKERKESRLSDFLQTPLPKR